METRNKEHHHESFSKHLWTTACEGSFAHPQSRKMQKITFPKKTNPEKVFTKLSLYHVTSVLNNVSFFESFCSHKGATNLYFTHYLCVVIVLFNAGL